MSQGDIQEFPAHTVHPDRVLYKIHKSIHDPRFFSNSGDGRFDLRSGEDAGTCYIALSPVGSFVEVFGRFRLLTQQMIDERALSSLSLTRPLRLADVTDRSVLGEFGIAGSLSTGSDYQEAQEWALKLYEAGFDGVFYTARYDPSFTERSVAVFGNEELGEKLFEVQSQSIPVDLVEEVCREFGFTVTSSSTLL